MKERQIETPSGGFVGPLLAKVEEDRDTLKQLADRIGSGPNIIKEFKAWVVGEKASRVKLGAGLAGDFGEFEALEFLALGITGKLSLWLTLHVIAQSDTRLSGIDLNRLIATPRPLVQSKETRALLGHYEPNTGTGNSTVPDDSTSDLNGSSFKAGDELVVRLFGSPPTRWMGCRRRCF